MITIQGLTARQCLIADMIWAAPTLTDVNAIVRALGPDAAVVRDMMIAASFDGFTETDLASQVLDKFKK